MSDELGNNLLNPGDTPHDNIQFLVFCAAVLRAVNKFQGLLRFSIASAGNDHRLGANEAPPAIISIFLGDMLTDIFEQIEKAGSAKTTKSGGIMDIGVSVLPKLPRDAGDRNRTSPFAFTGNKFEFRAVSSNQSIALPNVALNVAVTESLDYVATELEKSLKDGKKLQAAVKALLTKLIKENKRIIFNGNGYSDEWQKDAGKRGLLNHRTSVDAYGEMRIKPDVVKAFEKYGVLNERELRARHEVALEQYNKTVNIEAQLMVLMANRYILPAAYQLPGRARQHRRRRSRPPARSAKETEARSTSSAKLTDEAKVRVDHLQELLEHEGERRRREAREVLPRQGHPGDGRAARSGRRASRASCRRTSGRCRPTGRCCSSSRSSGSSCRFSVRGAPERGALFSPPRAPNTNPRTANPRSLNC